MSTAATASAPAVRYGESSARRSAMGSDRVFDLVCIGVLALLAAAWLIPTLWALNTSLKDNGVAALGAAEVLADTS